MYQVGNTCRSSKNTAVLSNTFFVEKVAEKLKSAFTKNNSRVLLLLKIQVHFTVALPARGALHFPRSEEAPTAEVEGAGEDGGAGEAGLPLQLAQIVVELPLSAYRGPFQPAYRTVAGRRLTCVEV